MMMMTKTKESFLNLKMIATMTMIMIENGVRVMATKDLTTEDLMTTELPNLNLKMKM
jgi:hypothetical protein